MNVLGISCYYHDAAACLIQDGKVVAAAQEERFNRKRHSPVFPIQSINYCIQEAGISFLDIDHIAYYELPYLHFHRTVMSHLRSWPLSFPNFMKTMPHWLKERLVIPLVLEKELGFRKKPYFVPHHISHAASSFLVSPFEEAAFIVADSVGEWACTTVGVGRGNQIYPLREMRYPNSLGLFYTAITTYLGFRADSGEGKVMGLAAYGKPRYLDKLKQIAKIHDDGSVEIDQTYFGINTGRRMYTSKFIKEFGPARTPESPTMEDHYRDLAASLQAFTEEALVKIATVLQKETGLKKLCLSGGIFLNCIANRKVLDQAGFDEVFIQPAAGDSGGAIGAAAYIYNSVLGNPRTYVMDHASLGPSYNSEKIARLIARAGFTSETLSDDEYLSRVAANLAKSNVVGWFEGRMEFGPRALGNRSILANPCDPNIKDILNIKIKKREQFRPFAPMVTEEDAHKYFAMDFSSPFMLVAASVREPYRSRLPAITHVDGTARVQTVSKKDKPRMHRLLREFEKITGLPIILNTSFNQRGEPIVCTPEHALDCFERTQMDHLCIENLIVDREPATVSATQSLGEIHGTQLSL